MYLTLAEAKSYLGIAASSNDDALLTVLIEAATAAIERHCDRCFAAPSDSTRQFEAVQHASRTLLYLDSDLLQITSIHNGDGAVPLSDVLLLPDVPPHLALLLRPEAGYCWEGTITITGRWAYSAVPPAPIVQATREYVAYLYRGYDQQAHPDHAELRLPGHICDLLTSYRRLR